MKHGRPLPDHKVLVLIQYKAQADAQGNPLKDANGRFLKGDRTGFTVMEKRQGWGTEYADDIRNGEWEYSAFSTDGRFNANANYRGCFQCHKPHEKQDFVISLASLQGGAGAVGCRKPQPVPTPPAEELYHQGEAELERRRYEDARKACVEIVERHPNSSFAPRARFLLGEAYYRAADFDKAIAEFQTFLSFYPRHQIADLVQYRLAM